MPLIDIIFMDQYVQVRILKFLAFFRQGIQELA